MKKSVLYGIIGLLITWATTLSVNNNRGYDEDDGNGYVTRAG